MQCADMRFKFHYLLVRWKVVNMSIFYITINKLGGNFNSATKCYESLLGSVENISTINNHLITAPRTFHCCNTLKPAGVSEMTSSSSHAQIGHQEPSQWWVVVVCRQTPIQLVSQLDLELASLLKYFILH